MAVMPKLPRASLRHCARGKTRIWARSAGRTSTSNHSVPSGSSLHNEKCRMNKQRTPLCIFASIVEVRCQHQPTQSCLVLFECGITEIVL